MNASESARPPLSDTPLADEVKRLTEECNRWKAETEQCTQAYNAWQAHAGRLAEERDQWMQAYNQWKAFAEQPTQTCAAWMSEAERLSKERDQWMVEAERWKSEAERAEEWGKQECYTGAAHVRSATQLAKQRTEERDQWKATAAYLTREVERWKGVAASYHDKVEKLTEESDQLRETCDQQAAKLAGTVVRAHWRSARRGNSNAG